jgi:hypothetical protein
MSADDDAEHYALIETTKAMAVQALAETVSPWHKLGGEDPATTFENMTLETATDRVTAIMLVRIVAIVAATRTAETEGDHYEDLSTSTICRKALIESKPFPVSLAVIQQLRIFVYSILQRYNNHLSFHNYQHSTAVTVSTNKLIDLMLSLDSDNFLDDAERPVTFGLRRDPVALAALQFAALIHDVEHPGVTNRQLVAEGDPLAVLYNDQSVTEKNSLHVAFSELLKDDYKELRVAMFPDDGTYRYFRTVVINAVMSTDIASPEQTVITKAKWKEAFESYYAADQLQQGGRTNGRRRSSMVSNISMPKVGISRRGSAVSEISDVTADSCRKQIDRRNSNVSCESFAEDSVLLMRACPRKGRRRVSVTASPRKECFSRRNSMESIASQDSYDASEFANDSVVEYRQSQPTGLARRRASNETSNSQDTDGAISFANDFVAGYRRSKQEWMPKRRGSLESYNSMDTYDVSEFANDSVVGYNKGGRQAQAELEAFDSLLNPQEETSRLSKHPSMRQVTSENDHPPRAPKHTQSPTKRSLLTRHPSMHSMDGIADEPPRPPRHNESPTKASLDGGLADEPPSRSQKSRDKPLLLRHPSMNSLDGIVDEPPRVPGRDETLHEESTEYDEDEVIKMNISRGMNHTLSERKEGLDGEDDDVAPAEQNENTESIVVNSRGTVNRNMSELSCFTIESFNSVGISQRRMEGGARTLRRAKSIDGEPGNNENGCSSAESDQDEPSHGVKRFDSTKSTGTYSSASAYSVETSAVESIPVQQRSTGVADASQDEANQARGSFETDETTRNNPGNDNRSSSHGTFGSRASTLSTGSLFATESVGLHHKRMRGTGMTRRRANMAVGQAPSNREEREIVNRDGQDIDRSRYLGSVDDSSLSLTPPSSDDEKEQRPTIRHARSFDDGSPTAAKPRLGRKTLPRRASTSNVPARFRPLTGQRIDEDNPNNMSYSALLSSNTDLDLPERQDQPTHSVSRSRFQKRLGIRRSMDLSGESIEVYSICSSTGGSEMEADNIYNDEPDNLRATAVLETLLRAADVGHNLQSWESFTHWSTRMFMELMKAHSEGRGLDPGPGWFDNQIKIMESYLKPLALQLDDTGVFGDFNGAIFAQSVDRIRDRWLQEGFELTESLRKEASVKYPSKDSPASLPTVSG